MGRDYPPAQGLERGYAQHPHAAAAAGHRPRPRLRRRPHPHAAAATAGRTPVPDRARPPCGARGDAGCPNLLQRPRSRRNAGRETLIFRASARRRSRRGGPLQQIRTRTRPGPPQEPHAHHPAPAHPRHHDDPALRAAVPGEKGFNMKVIQKMVLKTRSTRVAATCSDESSSSGRLFGGVWMRSPGAMRRIVERWGAGAGRDDPFESPPGVLEGVGRGGLGGLVVRGGSGAPAPAAARTVPDDHPGRSRRAQRPDAPGGDSGGPNRRGRRTSPCPSCSRSPSRGRWTPARTCPRSAGGCSCSSTSAWATSPSGRRRRPCRAAGPTADASSPRARPRRSRRRSRR